MRKLIIIVLVGCFIVAANSSYSKTVPCAADVPLQDCFDPKDYITPVILLSSYSIYAKVITLSEITCFGTYIIAMYLHNNQIPKKYWMKTTCNPPTLNDINTYGGAEIENLLINSDSPSNSGLNLEEIRTGGQPIIFEVTFSGGPESGEINVYASTEDWNDTDIPPKPEEGMGPFITPWMTSLLLKSTGTITGSVKCDTHGGIGDCEVQVWSCCTQLYNTMTSDDGSFTINNVAEGDYSLKFLCSDDEHYVNEPRISLKAGETITLDVKAEHN